MDKPHPLLLTVETVKADVDGLRNEIVQGLNPAWPQEAPVDIMVAIRSIRMSVDHIKRRLDAAGIPLVP